jgi:two-component system sensor histidine kinase KdpD
MLRRLKPYAFATLAADITVAALVAMQPRLDLTVIALVMVLTVMFCALLWRSGPALLTSVICVLSFNYFFIAPFHTFVIAKQDDFIAFTAFAIIAIMIGQLSARAETRAEQAEARRIEIEDLYEKLKKASGEAAEAELLRRSERLKTALLDAVTHDLRTPLTSIKAAVTTILSELPKDDEYLRELLQVIDEESDRLNRFIQEMMDLARLEGGNTEWKHSDSTALEIIEIALERAAPLLTQHKVEVAVDDSLPHLLVDASAISQVLYSLLDNAAKYSLPHSRILVSAESSDSSLLIRIRDEGAGIAKEYRERVFDKFFRISNSGSRPGFGLGLSIAKGIVESHGGKIWIEDLPGKPGTSIAVTVPLNPVESLVRTA